MPSNDCESKTYSVIIFPSILKKRNAQASKIPRRNIRYQQVACARKEPGECGTKERRNSSTHKPYLEIISLNIIY